MNSTLIQPGKRGDFLLKEVYSTYTYAMINNVSNNKDYTLFLCYDHRINDDLAKISKFLFDDIKTEEKNCFITRIIWFEKAYHKSQKQPRLTNTNPKLPYIIRNK